MLLQKILKISLLLPFKSVRDSARAYREFNNHFAEATVRTLNITLPVAAVEPACGDVRLGSDSPATTGADEGAGALALVAGAAV